MIGNDNGHSTSRFLDKSKALSEARPSKPTAKSKKQSLAQEVWEFLETGPEQAVRIFAEFKLDEIPQIHLAIESVFPGIKTVRATEWTYSSQPSDWGPECRLFQMADGQVKSLVTSGILFCELPEDHRVIVVIRDERFNRAEMNILVELIGGKGQEEYLRQMLHELRSQVRSMPHFLQGQTINARGEPLGKIDKSITLDDVALPDATRQLLLQNTVDLLRNRERYKKWKIPLTRGIVLHGPPGNGKTMIGRALASMSMATFIQVNPEDLSDGGVGQIFKTARRLSPAIVFLEDLDFIAGHKYREFGSARLAELLVQLDGLERNDGLIVIATTNHLEMLDPAIKSRPNRFDVVIRIGEPELDARRKIIQSQIGELVSAEVINDAAKSTEGLSGAQVKETVIRACQIAIQGGLEPDSLNSSHFELAQNGLYQIKRSRPVGYATTS